MKIITRLLTGLGTVLITTSLPARAYDQRVCGESMVGSSQMAEWNLTSNIKLLKSTHEVLGVSKGPMKCYTSNGRRISKTCQICADVTLKAISALPPPDAIVIDPISISTTAALETTEEVVEFTSCRALSRLGDWGYYVYLTVKGSCDEGFRARIIGYRRNGKPLKDTGKYKFEEMKTLAHDVGVALTMRDGTVMNLGPVHETRRMAGSSYSLDQKYQMYPNAHHATLSTIEAILKNSNVLFWNKSGVCFRELLALSPPRVGVLPSIYTARVPLDFVECTKPEPGITVIQI